MCQGESSASSRRGAGVYVARWVLPSILLAGLVLGAVATAHACNTPVFRYAMYNWPPAPFFVFYMHQGETPAQDEKVNQLIAEMAEKGPAVANLLLEPVDVSAGEVENLPKPVKDAWEAYAGDAPDKAEPVHLVFSSWGAKLHTGRLDESTVRALVESPLRTKIGEHLRDGCATVMLFLPGSNEKENRRAEKVAKEVIAQAAAGNIPVESGYLDATFGQYMPPPGSEEDERPEDSLSEEERIAAASRLEIGFLKADRSDKAEQWLVRSLVAMEDDLVELAKQPMIFFCYGRGRAMPPYVGKGVNPENLAAEIQFLASACSCFVKDQNPGADMLIRWNWDATAEAMASKDPTMYGGPMAYQEFAPEEPTDPVAAAEPATEGEAGDGAAAAPSDQVALATADAAPGDPETNDPLSNGAGKSDTPDDSEQTEQTEKADGAVVAAGGEPPTGTGSAALDEPVGGAGGVAVPESQASASFADRQIWMLGIGLFVVAVIVLGAGSLLIAKRATPRGNLAS